MTSLMTVGGYLATWISRAGQAWGPNDVWNNGASWESMYGTSQSDLTGMTGSRDYWQHTVAHNDAGVWDNRYNAGYSAGDAAGYARADVAESPRALSSYTFTLTLVSAADGNFKGTNIAGAGAAGVLTNGGTYLTAVRPGYWSIYMVSAGYNNVGARIYTEGVQRAQQGDGTPNAPDWLAGIGAHWVGFINANGQIIFHGRSQQAGYNGTAIVSFVPVPGYQQ